MCNITIFPLFRLALVWMVGIGLGLAYHSCISIKLQLLWLGIGLLHYSFMYIYTSIKQTQALYMDIMALIAIFLMSYSHIGLHIAEQKKQAEWIKRCMPLQAYCVYIEKVYPTKHHRYTCRSLIKYIKKHKTWYHGTGTVQLFFSKHLGYNPKHGDLLLIYGSPMANTPRQISKQTPLQWYKRVNYGHFIKNKQNFIQLVDQPSKHLTTPQRIRLWCIKRLEQHMLNKPSIAFIEALLFGYKENLNPMLRKAYAHTGTVHSLVVSGLHVGMLYALIRMILEKLLAKRKFALLLESCILILLWLYAWLCTFLPPIVRATTMITMGKISGLLQRQNNSYNTLFGSAFFLLVYDPLLLFNVGFQFSYLATLGIIYLQPYLYRAIKVNVIGLNKLWQLTALSLAAQISTAPLAMYYFKQFPVYFIIANWLVVPAIFVILILSVLWIPCSFIPWVNKLLTVLLHTTIELNNALVYWIERWPYSTIHISIPLWSVGLLYLFIIACCLYFNKTTL